MPDRTVTAGLRRTESLGVRLRPRELRDLLEAAAIEGERPRTWARVVLLREARRVIAERRARWGGLGAD